MAVFRLQTNEVNQGDALEHRFTCLYAALEFPLVTLVASDLHEVSTPILLPHTLPPTLIHHHTQPNPAHSHPAHRFTCLYAALEFPLVTLVASDLHEVSTPILPPYTLPPTLTPAHPHSDPAHLFT